MIDTLDMLFNSFIGLGGAAMMFIVLTILAIAFKAPIPKAIEGGLRMAVALAN